jgi:lipoate-protein ligase B
MGRALETSARNHLEIIDCGVEDYGRVLLRQEQLHDHRVAGRVEDTVLVCEHPPVITLGARKTANKLLASPDSIAGQGIGIMEVTRGGGATAHNPGQLVLYPILDLRRRGLGAGEYVRTLEAIGLELLEAFGLQARTCKGLPGLWVKDRKIASIGVRISKGVTYHGMAVNFRNDLDIFRLLVPCGLEGVSMTSLLCETGKAPPMATAKEKLADLLRQHLC